MVFVVSDEIFLPVFTLLFQAIYVVVVLRDFCCCYFKNIFKVCLWFYFASNCSHILSRSGFSGASSAYSHICTGSLSTITWASESRR